jgi:hypothetical protein
VPRASVTVASALGACTVEHEAPKVAKKEYDAALRKVAEEQAKLPGGVSMKTIEGYRIARAAYQKAFDAVEKIKTLPSYWEYWLGECKKQTKLRWEEMQSAKQQLASEGRQPGGASKPTQDQYGKARAAYKDATTAEEKVRVRRDGWQREYERMLGITIH